jgi:hypothetical protein
LRESLEDWVEFVERVADLVDAEGLGDSERLRLAIVRLLFEEKANLIRASKNLEWRKGEYLSVKRASLPQKVISCFLFLVCLIFSGSKDSS